MIRLIRNYATITCGFILCVYMLAGSSNDNQKMLSAQQEKIRLGLRSAKKILNFGDHRLQDFSHSSEKPLEVRFTIEKDVTIFDEVNFSEYNDNEIEILMKNTLTSGYFDKRARYKMFPNTFLAKRYFQLSQEPACVALQSSVDLASSIRQYIKNWPGSISFSLFAPSYHFYFAIVYIKHLRKCHKAVRDQISWHLSHPKLLPPSLSLIHLLRLEFNCSVPDAKIFKVLESTLNSTDKNIPRDLLYPQNTMRNLARQHCKTEWVMCPDIDMVFPDLDPDPSTPSMYSKLNTFLKTPRAVDCEKCAFVFPLYEIKNFDNRVPSSKKVLLEYVKKQSAQIYHTRIFVENQRQSNLSDWEKLPLKDEIQISAKINYTWWYEPVYIVKQGAPNFDERYIGYGMTRNTQALEMHLAEYTFFLIDSIFLCHLWGIKRRKPGRNLRSRQVSYNTKIFFTYHASELAVRYDTDLGDLLSTITNNNRFHRILNIGVHVKPTNKSNIRDEYARFLGYFYDKIPGSYGF